MDPTLALIHADRPALVTSAAVVLAGSASPTVIPLSVLPPAIRAGWLIGDQRAPLATRVEAALDVGRHDDAWALLRRRIAAIDTDLPLSRVLLRWYGAESARLELPSSRAVLVEWTGGKATGVSDDAAMAVGIVRDLFSALPWPRWMGPALAVGADDERLMPRDVPRLSRAVLPVIRLSHAAPGRQRGPEAAGALTHVVLDLAGPPATGWPEWLRAGCVEVAKGVARGEGPSPRAMHARRQLAGAVAIRALFTAAEPDPALAMAVCAPLLHSKRRHLLTNLLDPLRHGADAESAISIAYGLTIETLLSER